MGHILKILTVISSTLVNADLPRFTTVWTRGSDKNYTYINYDEVDTVIAWGNPEPELVEYVHSKNTKVQWMEGDPGISQFTNETFMLERVDYYVNKVLERDFDGINFDFEGSTYTQESKDNWVKFLTVLNQEFKKLTPPKYVTIDIPWTPSELWCLGGRCYPVKDLADAVDYMIIMGYDAEEDWWGGNVFKHTTDPYYRIHQGLREYIDCLEIPPYKLTLGLPWYSFNAKCNKNQPEKGTHHPDREYQCLRKRFSKEDEKLEYMNMLPKFLDFENRVDTWGNSMAENAANNYFYSKVEDSFFFHWKDPESSKLRPDIYEYWMDAVPGNYTPYERRLQLAVDSGVSGLGLWRTDALDHEAESDAEQEYNAQMWKLYSEYSAKMKPSYTSNFNQDDEYLIGLCRKYRDRPVPVWDEPPTELPTTTDQTKTTVTTKEVPYTETAATTSSSRVIAISSLVGLALVN